MNCITHHDACECREHNFATMIKAMLDVTMELDWLKNEPSVNAKEKERLEALVQRAYVAIEVVQFKAGEITGEFAARMTCCAECES